VFTVGTCPFCGYIRVTEFFQGSYELRVVVVVVVVVAAEAREQASSKPKEYRRVQEVSL
jgi:hypothetical protein